MKQTLVVPKEQEAAKALMVEDGPFADIGLTVPSLDPDPE